MSHETNEIKCESLTEALVHMDKVAGEAQINVKRFEQNFEELTGYKPNQPISALDVYKIFNKLSANA